MGNSETPPTKYFQLLAEEIFSRETEDEDGNVGRVPYTPSPREIATALEESYRHGKHDEFECWSFDKFYRDTGR